MNSLDWEWELAYAWSLELNRLDEAAEAALYEDDEA